MGPLVVDSSALIEYLSAGSADSPPSAPLRSHDLHVPEVCDVEIVSALRRPVLAGRLSLEAMRLLLLDYADLPLRRHRHLPLIGRAFDLYANVAAADAMYIALAERLDAPLLTSDLRLGRAIRTHTSVSVLP